MPRYVRNESEYPRISCESKKIRAAMKRKGKDRKQPTSVALDPRLIAELKSEARARGVPYQVPMRMFIVEGCKRLKRAR